MVVVTKYVHNDSDLLHNSNGPAYIEKTEDGQVIYEEYWIDGKLHNVNGPACVYKPLNENLVYIEKWIDGKFISQSQMHPFKIVNGNLTTYHLNNGDKISEHYYKDGKFHNDDGPAWIKFDSKTGRKTSIKYYIDGKLHNDNGPALVTFNDQGEVSCEMYHLNGELHREDGPAVVYYDKKHGNYETFYNHGKKLNKVQ